MKFIYYLIMTICFIHCLLKYTRISIVLRVNNQLIYKTQNNYFEFLIIMGLFLLITSNRNGVDIINYFNAYNYKVGFKPTFELFYNYARFFAHYIGISFFLFRAIFLLITGIFAVFVIKKLNIDIYFFTIFYLPILLFMDSMQVRNSSAICFLLFGIYCLATYNGKKGKMFFLLAIFTAFMIHTSFIFYFIVILYNGYNNKRLKSVVIKIIVISSIVLSIITFINGHRIPYIEKIYSLLLKNTDSRNSRYLTSGSYGFLYPLFVYLISLNLFNKLENNINNKNNNKYRFIEISHLMAELSVIFIPFIMMNMNYYRFFRNTLYFLIISTSLCINETFFIVRKKMILIILQLVFIVFLWWLFDVYIYNTPEIIIAPIFKDGVIFYK